MTQQLEHFDINTSVQVEAEFRSIDGDLTNPTAVSCMVQSPSGTRSTPSPTNPSTGLYRATFTVTEAGKWWYRFEGTGALIASSPDKEFVVRKSVFHQG